MSTLTKPKAIEVDRCSSCEVHDPQPTPTYVCSRCSGEHTQDMLDGPPYRCPECRIFMGKGEDDACSECSEPLVVEHVTVYVCSGCGDEFDSVDVEHDCTDDEKAATAAVNAADKAKRLAEADVKYGALDDDAENVTLALRALGFSVRTYYERRPCDDGIGSEYEDDDVFVYPSSSSQQLSRDAFNRLVLLAAAKQEV